MDHGILNVPLSKRPGGSIDNQIDKYNKAIAKKEAEKRKLDAQNKKTLVAQAKAVVEGLSDERIKHLSAKFKMTPKQTIKYLNSQAFWMPELIIKL